MKSQRPVVKIPVLLSFEEVAEYLQIPIEAVHGLIGKGKLRVEVLFQQEWIERDSAELWNRENKFVD